MSLPVPTTIATGQFSAAGSCYRVGTDQLYVTCSGNPDGILALGAHSHVTTVLGTGYVSPHDVELSADGLHAYVTESPGSLLRLSLTNMNRSAATVVASGMNGVDQIALDEAHGVAYVAEFTGGHIQQINLTSGARTVVATVAYPRGVLVTDDGRFVYASSDAGTITRFDLSTNTSRIVASGLTGPRYLEWPDAGESTILFAESIGTVMKADLTTTPAKVTVIAGPTPASPISVTVLSSNQLMIAGGNYVSEVDLTASVYSAAGPVFLGIGFVPADTIHLPSGYADTTVDPSYFFQVKDCPFGGTLPLMINWESARSAGANFYQVFIAGPSVPATQPGTQVTQAFTDELWSVALNEFESFTTTASSSGGYFQLRQSGQIWLNPWLGLLLDTAGQPNGLNRISIKLFSAESAASEIGTFISAGRSATVMIDNSTPVANLIQIYQQPGNVAVGACGLVTSGTPTFTFTVTASAPQSHLLGWNLVTYWGDNKSATVASDSYSNHVSPSRLWAGITSTSVPSAAWSSAVAGDPTSTHCAHSFFVNAWDRVINGWGYVHGVASYQKSITILL
jgi:hypothetical protein